MTTKAIKATKMKVLLGHKKSIVSRLIGLYFYLGSFNSDIQGFCGF